MKNKLAVIILTFNEENHITEAIESIQFADEIILIDSFSTDSTIKLAQKFDIKIHQNKFKNYSDQRNFALSKTQAEWILFLDADERVTQILKTEILQAIESEIYSAYKIWFPHYFMNSFLFHYTDKVIRLMKNEGLHFKNEVHEKAVINGKIGVLKNYMVHKTYKGLENYIAKKNNYAFFQAKMMHKKNKKATLFKMMFKPFYRFFHTYFVKRVFLDGVPGFASVTIDAYGVFLRYVKLIQLQEKENIKKV
jgi:glycosyltransferase involved in cell wall biosynthesis